MGTFAKKHIPKRIGDPINQVFDNGRSIKKNPIKRNIINRDNINELINYRLLSYKKVLGNKMYLQKPSFLSKSLARRGIYEETLTKVVMNEIKKGDVVLDLGANIGYYTLIIAKIVGENGHVFAFEPEPSNFDLLKKNVTVNNYRNVSLEKIVISNKNGNVRLYLSKANTGEHRIYLSNPGKNNFINVEMKTLDEYFKNNSIIDKISFIKMDVEGSEIGAIKGMNSILENKKLTIMLEFDPRQIQNYGASPEDLLNILDKHGFDFSHEDKQKCRLEKVKMSYLLKFVENLQPTNLVCTKI